MLFVSINIISNFSNISDVVIADLTQLSNIIF